MGLRVSLTGRPSSFRRTSANDRPEETLTCSTAIVCDVTECCVVACVMSAPASPAVFKCGEAAHLHMVTTSRRACRVPQATVSQRRRRVAVRAPTELGFAAAFRATSARPQRRYAVEQPTADGNETWLTRFLAAAMARRSKEAIRRASASTKPTFTKNRDRLPRRMWCRTTASPQPASAGRAPSTDAPRGTKATAYRNRAGR